MPRLARHYRGACVAVTGGDGAIRSGRGGRRTRQSCVRLQWVVAGDPQTIDGVVW